MLRSDYSAGEVARRIEDAVNERAHARYMLERDISDYLRKLRTEQRIKSWLNAQLFAHGLMVVRRPGRQPGDRHVPAYVIPRIEGYLS